MNPRILIVVQGGVATPICCTGSFYISEIDVVIVDKDVAQAGGEKLSESTVEKVSEKEFSKQLREAKK